MKTVTREWVLAHVKCGAPNADQVRLLGLHWPIKKGWLHRVEGRRISDEAAEMFEFLHGKKKSQRPKFSPPRSPRVQQDFLTEGFKDAMREEPTSKPVICDCKFNIPPWEECPQCVG